MDSFTELAAVEIADGVWLGRFPDRAVRDALGMASLVDLTAELPVDSTGVEYRGVPLLDLVPPSAEQLDKAVEAIDDLKIRPMLGVLRAEGTREARRPWLRGWSRAAVPPQWTQRCRLSGVLASCLVRRIVHTSRSAVSGVW